MLRQDKRAHIEKQLQTKWPIYDARPPPKSKWEHIGNLELRCETCNRRKGATI